MQKLKIFISSVQREFAEERKQLLLHFKTDALLSQFFEPVLFEELPARCQAPNKVYLKEVEQSQVYLLLVGKDYGYEDANGISPTELEYEHAKTHRLDSLAFIKGNSHIERHEKENLFFLKIQNELSYKQFYSIPELISNINSALVTLLKHKGLIQLSSFDESLHPTAQVSDIDPAKIDNFLSLANFKRGFPLKQGSAVEKVLTHLHLLSGDKICNSALLAFGKMPQQFFPMATTKCAHFHGYFVEKPIPDHKVFQGDVFEQVDQAVDFVLSKISASVGTRDYSTKAPIRYEIPKAVVAEAIVNAVAHRDYTSNGSVQVMLFADRLEIFNPGKLTPELSLVKLKADHSSYPTNLRLAEPMYQAGYIERFGTGTGEIFRLTAEAGLKEPTFDFEEGFKITIWRPNALNTPATEQVSGQVTGQVTGQVSGQVSGQVTGQVSGQVGGDIAEGVKRLLLVLFEEMKSAEIQYILDLKHREYFRENYLNPALTEGYIEMTIPNKPTSSYQKYRLTKKGIELKNSLFKPYSVSTENDNIEVKENDFNTLLYTLNAPVSAQVTGQVTGQVSGQVSGQVTGQVGGDISEGLKRLLMVLFEEMKSIEIQDALELKHRGYFKDNYLNPAIEEGYIETTIPNKPTSSNQKYRLTKKGIELKNSLFKSYNISTKNYNIDIKENDFNTPPYALSTSASSHSTPPLNTNALMFDGKVSTPAFDELPKDLLKEIKKLKKRSNDKSIISDLILRICSHGYYKSAEIAHLLNKSEDYIKRNFLSSMITSKKLMFKYPKKTNHPEQAYKTTE